MRSRLCPCRRNCTAALNGSTAGYMQHICPMCLQLLGNINHIIEVQSAITIFISRDSHIDDEIRAAYTPNFFNNLQCKLQSSIDISPIFITAFVVKRCQKTAKKTMRMCSMNFHTVTPCLLNTKGCFSKLAYDNLQLFNCNRTGSFFCIGRSHIGRGNQTWCAWNRECHIGRVKQLWKDLGTILMHCIC